MATVEDRLQLRELLEEHEDDLDGRGRRRRAPSTQVSLDGLDVLAFLHLAGEVLLVGGGEEEDLADLAQVHAHRVVDALLVFQGTAACVASRSSSASALA